MNSLWFNWCRNLCVLIHRIMNNLWFSWCRNLYVLIHRIIHSLWFSCCRNLYVLIHRYMNFLKNLTGGSGNPVGTGAMTNGGLVVKQVEDWEGWSEVSPKPLDSILKVRTQSFFTKFRDTYNLPFIFISIEIYFCLLPMARYCFHRCLSVYTWGEYPGQVQTGESTPKVGTPSQVRMGEGTPRLDTPPSVCLLC